MKKSCFTFVLVCTLLFTVKAVEDANRTRSPYFEIKSTDPDKDKLELNYTVVDANIAGVIADVTVRQVYINKGNEPIEANYVFPGSTRAAVYGMQMKVGKRYITAHIAEKYKAREVYEEAKAEGLTASLLEQHRPNVFQMNVANILPGDTITVEFNYTELLTPTEGEYEFMYPTVVGPRYSNTLEDVFDPDNDWVNRVDQEMKDSLARFFDINVHLNTGLPIQTIYCATYPVDIKKPAEDQAEISLYDTIAYKDRRDFILKYRLTGSEIQSGVLLYEGEEENFFLAMMQPPKRVLPQDIPPREYIFIVDVSGSMNGEPLSISKELFEDLLTSLQPDDLFNVLLFAGGNNFFSKVSVPATPKNIRKAINMVGKENGAGGTELLPALKQVFDSPKLPGYSRTIVVATDGFVTVEDEAFELVRNNLDEANFFPFGIGGSVNRHLIEGLARAGKGEPFIIEQMASANEQAARFRKYISSPVLTDIDVDYAGFKAYEIQPYKIPDVFAERPIVIIGKYKNKANGKIKITGLSGGGKEYTTQLDVSSANSGEHNSALRYLWARQQVQALGDVYAFGTPKAKVITELGLKYNLLTDYTSFVAVDDTVRQGRGNEQGDVDYHLEQKVEDLVVSVDVLPGVQINSSSMACVMVSASKYETRIMESACSIEYISHRRSLLDVVYFRGVEVWVNDPTFNDYDWEAHERRKAERKAKRQERRAKRRIPKVGDKKVTQAPEFKGGETKIQEFFEANMIYPALAKTNKVEGIVNVSCVVDKDGNLTEIEVLNSIDEELKEEAMRLIKLMPNWEPGMVSGNPASIRITIPIEFKL